MIPSSDISCPQSAHLTSHSCKPCTRVRAERPSLSDRRFSGDPWIVLDEEGKYVLWLGDYALASVLGSHLDLPALNSLLDPMRNHQPRHRFMSFPYIPTFPASQPLFQ